jgi:hypothetical protein
MRDEALKLYKGELNRPTSLDLGLQGPSRASLRVICRSAVLESSLTMRKKYSQSQMSSVHSAVDGEKNVMSALRILQKERLIVTRLGFPDKAMELDKEIELMRVKVKIAREKEEETIVAQRMKLLGLAHMRKQARLEYILSEEWKDLMTKNKEEEDRMVKRQELEFLRVLESATRRAIGRVKKCNCDKAYLCRHNKTASYNTRKPSKVVVQYRRNARRLRQAGRPEEGLVWDEKAKALDDIDQEGRGCCINVFLIFNSH